MTHTSTEQPEALMKLADDYADACFDQALHQRTTDDKPEAAREKLEKELRRLHARVQELEASQAQREPVQCVVPPQINQMLNRRMYATGWADCLRAHGITQEKQG